MVLLRDATGDGEAKAVTGFARVQSDETFKDALDLVFGYARSIIGDDRSGEAVHAGIAARRFGR